MSNISDSATVTLLVNGAQAKKVIDDLKNNLDQARKKLQQLEDAKASPKDIERARKEVRKLEKQLEEARSITENVKDALENVDKVSLNDLNKTLRALHAQFKNAKQGSEAYEDLARKIRIVKEQISAVKEELKESQGPWERFKSWAMDAWPALDLLRGWYDTAISTLRGFVDAYAEMDQEMASVRKFTGMTEAQIAELNEQFKDIDTRSSREQLNMLAQDAGRLGKQSVEDVMGFVR
ncbi:MAG: phage tail tape measure protein, partial [Muribaculaceae bacterium]|nr:phage tail tape measure protein [Muribaculaceae bacterium]